MFETLLSEQIQYLQSLRSYRNFEKEIRFLEDTLDSDGIITLGGIANSGKTKLLAQFLEKSSLWKQVFYYNSELDSLGSIQSEKDLITLMDVFIHIYGIPKIIILQNCNNIKGIKTFISQIIKTKKYKLIIAGNSIKIQGVKNISLYPLSYKNVKPENYNFGGIPEVRIIPHEDYKRFLLGALRHDMISREIIENYSIKNIGQFYKVLSFLSTQYGDVSLREIHRILQVAGIEISLLTLIDYINAALNTHILHRVYCYDFKNENTINSKAKYYFGDIGIRYAFSGNPAKLENILFLEFLMRGYEVSSGIHGRFEFDFYVKKGERHICIALAEAQNDKNEIRKIARKLAKIPGNMEKYVLITKSPDLLMRKYEEEGVKLLEFQEFFSYFED